MASNEEHVDPYLFTVLARVKQNDKVACVKASIVETLEGFAAAPVAAELLENVKSHLRYRFALGLNHSEAIASTLAHYVSLQRTPATINRLYRMYDELTPEDLQRVAQRYFVPAARTTVTLAHGAQS